MCAFVKRILHNGSSLFLELKSSHWKARLIFANAKIPSGFLSLSRLDVESCGMTREMNEEPLFNTLFLGFRRFNPSFDASVGLPSPNAGADAWL
jgi:hypothetical protein